MTAANQPVQTLVRAIRVPGAPAPYDTAHVTLTYPSDQDAAPVDVVGTLPPALDRAPFPVVLWFVGMNTDPAYYRWYGNRIAEAGYLFVTFTYVGPVPPGTVGITPGTDIELCRPDTFGTAPIGSLVAPLLDLVAEVNADDGPLQGRIDTDRVAFGGHSAGGNVSLNSAAHKFFPQVRAAFSYGSHTMAATMLGWPGSTVLPLSGDCPVLLMSATEDGLVAASAPFYDEGPDRPDPIGRTFDTLLGLPDATGAAGSVLLEIKGANHFSIAHPDDGGVPRRGEDRPETAPSEQIRDLIVKTTVQFLHQHVRRTPGAAAALTELIDGSPLATARFH